MTMLDIDRVALNEIAEALQDHSPEHSWWLDPRTGRIDVWSDWTDQPDSDHPEARGWICVEPVASREAYRDMEDFVALVRDRRAREVLARAIAGRGAFRRFKDALLEFPELRAAWFAMLDARMARRALAWLAVHGLIDRRDAERRAAVLQDPEVSGPGGVDGEAVARLVAGDLAELYGSRLRRVILFGSWARGDAHPESDVDLLVVLDGMRSSWEEGRRMDEVLWRRSLESGTVISAVPIAEADVRVADRPLVMRAIAEGLPLG
jgi:predicted nucleotidyltransferase